MIYTVVVKGTPPPDLRCKITEAHAEAIAHKSVRDFSTRNKRS